MQRMATERCIFINQLLQRLYGWQDVWYESQVNFKMQCFVLGNSALTLSGLVGCESRRVGIVNGN